jgi:hypothetical protein
MGEAQGDGHTVVFQLFAKPVRPAHGHAEPNELKLTDAEGFRKVLGQSVEGG